MLETLLLESDISGSGSTPSLGLQGCNLSWSIILVKSEVALLLVIPPHGANFLNLFLAHVFLIKMRMATSYACSPNQMHIGARLAPSTYLFNE
ncbi:hypothetical protein BDQ12DRAFT_366138 [Crucibulum laeve]|uniref:Uncharacterized protein n=1 Tax=Crucibulum laeve TaxID=68775 RepID=A0A5C3LQZ9_9AGAR|nr:hypothetical protein BDQ12DRAFT_366138 [Crucibulum laeve]